MRFRVLDGLSPYGPPALPFSTSSQGLHQEGLVVEFTTEDGQTWVGNFHGSWVGLDDAMAFPGTDHVLVIARGQAYVIDPDARRCVHTFSSDVSDVLALDDRLIFSNGLWLEAVAGARVLWQTRRISWDGIERLRLAEDLIRGESFDPMTSAWQPFTVDVDTGEVEGGSYSPG